MAKLFISVIPDSECEGNVKRVFKAFEQDCPYTVEYGGDIHDANYYEMDCSKLVMGEQIAQVLCENFKEGKYCSMGRFMVADPLMRSVYGLWKAEVHANEFSIADFIAEES